MSEPILEYPLGRNQRARLVWLDDDKTIVIKIESKKPIPRPADKRMTNALKDFLFEMRN